VVIFAVYLLTKVITYQFRQENDHENKLSTHFPA